MIGSNHLFFYSFIKKHETFKKFILLSFFQIMVLKVYPRKYWILYKHEFKYVGKEYEFRMSFNELLT